MVSNESAYSLRSMLRRNAEYLVQSGKGILAADEEPSALNKRFHALAIENNAEQRRVYRQILFTTPKIAMYLSGVLMHEETFHQTNDSSVLFPIMLTELAILPGITLDRGLQSLTAESKERITLGCDDLEQRAEDFYKRGARFAKWRCVFRLDAQRQQPSNIAILSNMISLARFASICQSKGLVPILESNLIADGNNEMHFSQHVTEKILSELFHMLREYDVYLEGCVLKASMIRPGQASKKNVKSTEIALATITALSRTCPAALAGIVLLSGGQSEEEATVHLNAINQPIYAAKRPWPVTFAFGRALQISAMRVWNGKRENESLAQESFFERAAANSAASRGEYQERKEAK